MKLLMEEMPNNLLGCIKPYKFWDKAIILMVIVILVIFDQIEPPKQTATISAISTHLTCISPLFLSPKKGAKTRAHETERKRTQAPQSIQPFAS